MVFTQSNMLTCVAPVYVQVCIRKVSCGDAVATKVDGAQLGMAHRSSCSRQAIACW